VYAFELMHVTLGWQEKFSGLESNGPCTTIYWTMCNTRSYQQGKRKAIKSVVDGIAAGHSGGQTAGIALCLPPL
jgi:hypothetical protein